MTPFVHLSTRSFYSILRGVGSPRDLCRQAHALGMGAIALTDFRGLYGAVPFYNAARETGIRPLFGAAFPASTPGAELVVLARNAEGYRNLCRIVTADQMARPKPGALAALAARGETPPPDPLIEIVQRHARGIVCIASAPAWLRDLREALEPDSLYAELYRPDTREARALERHVLEAADYLGLRAVACARAHFPRAEDYPTHRLLAAIRTLKTVDSLAPGDAAAPSAFLASPAHMARLFADRPDALRATLDIADACRVELPLGARALPRYEPPEGQNCEDHLRALCVESLGRLYAGGPERAAARARLDWELDVICSMGYAAYFLVVWDIVRFTRERGIPATGRGSAADSLVAYLLGFTHVDPIRHNLYFERFLNPARSSPPDIDIDLCWRRRDEVVDYVYRRWGAEHVAMISTHVTLSGRSALREAGKAIGLSESEIGRYTRHLPHLGSVDLAAVQRDRPEARELDLDAEPLRTLAPMVRAIQGLPSHLGVHPSGIVVSPMPLADIVPLERAAKGIAVTQYDMYPIEDLGLMKIDLLGQRSLSVIADVAAQVRRERDPGFRFHKIDAPPPDTPPADPIDPERDEATRRLMASGRTLGVFQVESPAMRGLLRKVRAQDFETVTAASSVIRPGPKDSGMLRSWVRRHTGREAAQYLHPRLREVLGETHGIIVYQEDVLKVAQAIAGMSLARADQIRRSMSDKRPDEPLLAMEEEFLEGARRNGVSPSAAREIWRQVRAFGGYAFCKAHSASYTVLSFQSAWLKAHYPAEFMAAVLANGGGYYDRAAYVSEARRLGLRILPPSIAQSSRQWSGAGRAIRCGLDQIGGLTDRAIDAILAARPKAPQSLAQALERLEALGPAEWESLVRCGACDDLPLRRGDAPPANRPTMLWLIDRYFAGPRPGHRVARQLDFLESVGEPSIDEAPPDLPDFSAATKFDDEMRILGLAVMCHPLRRYRKLLPDAKRSGILPASELARSAGRRVRLIGWLVTTRRYRASDGRVMKFLCLEDETDIYEATLFDRAYRRYGHLTLTRGPYLLEGRAEDEDGNVTLNVERLELLRPTQAKGLAPDG